MDIKQIDEKLIELDEKMDDLALILGNEKTITEYKLLEKEYQSFWNKKYELEYLTENRLN